MGTGTSHGIPVIGCSCHTCTSPHKKDKRLRCSAYLVESHDIPATTILIDVGPEFRMQALTYHITRLDAVLLTHSHADHLHGIDDLRIFSHTKSTGKLGLEGRNPLLLYPETSGDGLPVYANQSTIDDVTARFSYIFSPTREGGGKPKLALRDCAAYAGSHPLSIGSVSILPVPMLHGTMETTGWLMSCLGVDGQRHSIAYLTDCNKIPAESLSLLKSYGGIIDHVVIDGLRSRPHSTHFSFNESLACAACIGGYHTWLTHICHDMRHREIQQYINSYLVESEILAHIVHSGGSVAPAYDGLVLSAGE